MSNMLSQNINDYFSRQNAIAESGENEAKASYVIHCRPRDLYQAQIAARSRFRLDQIINQTAKIYLGVSIFNSLARPFCPSICMPMEWLNTPGACSFDLADTVFSIALVGTITIAGVLAGGYVMNPIARRIFGEEVCVTPQKMKEFLAAASYDNPIIKQIIGSSSPVEIALNDAILGATREHGSDK